MVTGSQGTFFCISTLRVFLATLRSALGQQGTQARETPALSGLGVHVLCKLGRLLKLANFRPASPSVKWDNALGDHTGINCRVVMVSGEMRHSTMSGE